MVFEVLSQNYGQRCFTVKLEGFCSDICTFEQKIVNMFLLARTFVIFSQKVCLLDHMIEDVLRLQDIPASNASLCKQFKGSIKAECHRNSKRRVSRLNEMLFGLERVQTNAP